MVIVKVECDNCQCEYKHKAKEAFEMATCPACKAQKMVRAIGQQSEHDPRVVTPVRNRFVEPG